MTVEKKGQVVCESVTEIWKCMRDGRSHGWDSGYRLCIDKWWISHERHNCGRKREGNAEPDVCVTNGELIVF